MPLYFTIFAATAIALLAVTILIVICKLFFACSAVIHGDSVKVKYAAEIFIIFICVLIIALYFML